MATTTVHRKTHGICKRAIHSLSQDDSLYRQEYNIPTKTMTGRRKHSTRSQAGLCYVCNDFGLDRLCWAALLKLGPDRLLAQRR
eukprot:5587497-Amphidinium_carterae.1